MLAGMSRTEMFIAGGSLLILLTDLIFIFVGGYFISIVTWAAAAVALLAVLFHRRLPAAMAPNYQWLLIVLGALIVLTCVRWLVGDVVWLAANSARLDGEYLLGMIGLYAGAALVAVGTWQLWKSRA